MLPFGMDSSITANIVPNEITRWATKILGSISWTKYDGTFYSYLPENRLNMEHFYTKVISLEDGIAAFEYLGLKYENIERQPKSAMKIVMRP